MRFVSLFAGLGAFDLALEGVGMVPVLQCEIDQHCRRILKHHWPNVRKAKDVRKLKAKRVTADLVCGGWPCQDLSVAGKRAGLGGERSGLFHEFVRIVAAIAPRWVLAENVPGLFSSWSPTTDPPGGILCARERGRRVVLDEESDFDTVIRGLVQLGYGVAWRVLDAQYAGVPQRRRRVFIVGCLGDAASAAKVLFEPESCGWHSPPRREAGARTAATTGVCATLNSGGHTGGFRTEPGEHLIVDPLAYQCHGSNVGPIGTLRKGRGDASSGVPFIAHSLRAEGHDASEDGTGRGVPLVTVRASGHGGSNGLGVYEHGDAPTVDTTGNLAVCFERNEVREMPISSSVKAHPGMKNQAYVFQTRIARNGRGQPKETADALTSCEGGTHADSKPHVAFAGGVRRLLPVECVRLMGLPDLWLELDPPLADSQKYKMLGNSVVVPVVAWIGRRILDAARRGG